MHVWSFLVCHFTDKRIFMEHHSDTASSVRAEQPRMEGGNTAGFTESTQYSVFQNLILFIRKLLKKSFQALLFIIVDPFISKK